MKFWDASALVSLAVRDDFSLTLRAVFLDDPEVVIWWATPVECEAALRRAERGGRVSAAQSGRVVERFNLLFEQCAVVAPSSEIVSVARGALRRHPLSAADALQLAAGLVWAREVRRESHFVCLDRRLRTAARDERFIVLPG